MRSRPVGAEIAVPFLDLQPSHGPVKDGILAEISSLLDSSAFTNGRQVGAFEEAFAAYCGVRNCVGLGSGLDALRLGLLAMGLRPGDEVIVPAHTFAATFEAVTQARGRPVPVDVQSEDYNLDVAAAASSVSSKTRFVLPVHLYGQLSDMRAVRELAETANLQVLEDACQAHGATRDGFRAGSGGTCGAFSFYPGKNLGAFGDAGALTTNDDGLAAHVRALREHGQRQKYHHDFEGYTARLDTIQAVALLHKLPFLDGWNAERRRIAAAYIAALEGIGDLRLPPVPSGSEPSWHLFVIRTADPDGLATYLGERGIMSGRHYPQPLHLSAAYAWLGYQRGAFPVTEAIAAEALSLPIFPGMTDAQIGRVVENTREFFERS
jgi:dTDP-3-amino-3,4,6-trideoxy-alpha-D-glucose transaminase